MPTYNKLVRDYIPEVIEKSGKAYSSRLLEEEEYEAELKKKFAEELKEYEETNNSQEALEELADILELIHAAAEVNGVTFKELEEIRAAKAEKRGGFKKRIFLIEVEDDEA